MSDPTPLFIVGCARSGTSVVRDLVRRMDGVYLPPDELQLMAPLLEAQAKGVTSAGIVALLERSAFSTHMRRRQVWPDHRQLSEVVDADDLAGTIRRFVLLLAAQEGIDASRHWGDKTPTNLGLLGPLAELFPDLRVIEVRRDPRDTVVSMRRAWGRSLVRGAIAWDQAIRQGEAAATSLGPDRRRVMHYEQLTADPVGSMQELADWMGTNIDATEVTGLASEERWGQARGQRGVARPTTGWSSTLTAAQVRTVEEITFDTLALAGYSPTLATNLLRPGRRHLQLLRATDAIRSLDAYRRERGLRQAIAYKTKQWRERVRADDPGERQ